MWVRAKRRGDNMDLLLNTRQIVQMEPVEGGKFTGIWQEQAPSRFDVCIEWNDMIEIFESSTDESEDCLPDWNNGEFYKD